MLVRMDDEYSADHEHIARAKSALRLHGRAARRTVLPEMRQAHAYALAERVLALPELARATTALLYGASTEEADPSVLEFALRERGVRIAYPRVAGPYSLSLHWVDSAEVLQPGAFGLLEPLADAPPAPLDQLAVIVVPGIAFDADGNRLGFGGGYYDTLLAGAESPPPTVGFAFDEQVVDEVPHEDHDRPLDIVVTPTRTMRRATTTP